MNKIEYNDCIKKGKITNFSRGKKLTGKELTAAENDLKIAQLSAENKHFKWATIQTYYSMFHSARALLYHKSLREHSHYCLILAVKELYVKTQILSNKLIEALKTAKNLREEADYYDRWSEEGYKSLEERAKEFLKLARGITGKKDSKYK